ncbi:copper amine oxidase N-terminal domain-containing protein [Bacillaceae bacterium]
MGEENSVKQKSYSLPVHRTSLISFGFFLALLAVVLHPSAAMAESSAIIFDLAGKTTYVDGRPVASAEQARVIEGRLFVPVRFLAENLGFHVHWDKASRTIHLQTKKGVVILNEAADEAVIGEQSLPFASFARIVDDKLFLSARAMADLLELHIQYDPSAKRVVINEKGAPAENRPPVARFTTDKEVYKMGEPVKLINLSYDPDGDPYFLSWEGKEEAYFAPGEYTIVLHAKDQNGNVGEPFAKTIRVSDETLVTQEEFPFYFGSLAPQRTSFPLDISFSDVVVLEPQAETQDASRKLVVSDSPETFTEYGIFYEEKLANGRYRLYATHLNGTKETAQVYAVVRNTGAEEATIRVLQKGEAEPSNVAERLGAQALAAWFSQGKTDESIVIPPGESYLYYASPPLNPGEGIHFIHDAEVTGEATISFFALRAGDDISRFRELPKLAKQGHIRGTFDVSTIERTYDASLGQKHIRQIIIGGGEEWVNGTDAMTGASEKNRGNFGVHYRIRIENPGRSAIVLAPRGGLFKGAAVYNGQVVTVPHSGIVAPGQAFLLGRTTGDEGKIELELMPPSGSYLPFDLLLYPLRDLEATVE